VFIGFLWFSVLFLNWFKYFWCCFKNAFSKYLVEKILIILVLKVIYLTKNID